MIGVLHQGARLLLPATCRRPVVTFSVGVRQLACWPCPCGWVVSVASYVLMVLVKNHQVLESCEQRQCFLQVQHRCSACEWDSDGIFRRSCPSSGYQFQLNHRYGMRTGSKPRHQYVCHAVVAFEGAHIADSVKVVSTCQGRLTNNGFAFAREIAGTSSCSNSPSTGGNNSITQVAQSCAEK